MGDKFNDTDHLLSVEIDLITIEGLRRNLTKHQEFLSNLLWK